LLSPISGVLVILMHGDLETAREHRFHKGDVLFHRRSGDLRGVFGAVGEAAANSGCRSSPSLSLAARRANPSFDLGNCLAPGDAARCRDLLTLFTGRVFPSTLAYCVQSRRAGDRPPTSASRSFTWCRCWVRDGMVFLGERPQLFHVIGLLWCDRAFSWRAQAACPNLAKPEFDVARGRDDDTAHANVAAMGCSGFRHSADVIMSTKAANSG